MKRDLKQAVREFKRRFLSKIVIDSSEEMRQKAKVSLLCWSDAHGICLGPLVQCNCTCHDLGGQNET